MKLGMIVRAEDRGLGNLTWEAYRHLQPDRTLLVDMGPLAKGFPAHPDRYPDAQVAHFDGTEFHDPDAVKRWLAGLDVVYTAETFYDWRAVTWARERRVRTVLHVMPEFFRHHISHLPIPTRFWTPTSWRREHLPPATREVPVPVATDRFARHPLPTTPPTFLHLIGHTAAADRAGTLIVLAALAFIHVACRIIIRTQDRMERTPARLPPNVDLTYETNTAGNYWEAYDGADVLVAPRRYGGLSLPLNEAAAAGLALIMPDSPPHPDTWPGVYVPSQPRGLLRTPVGEIPLWETDPRHLAAEMDRLITCPERAADAAAAAYAWAQNHSWDRLAGLWLTELHAATEDTP